MWQIIVGILLTGLLGGAISFTWQRRQWLFQQKFQRLSAIHEKQIATIGELTRLIHKRIYATRIYAETLVNDSQDRINAERARYRSVVEEWNELTPNLLIRVRVLFTYQDAIKIEERFHIRFVGFDTALRALRLRAERGDEGRSSALADIYEELRHLTGLSQEWMTEMLREADKSKAAVEERPAIEESNIHILSHFYLLKSLFEPRQQL